MTPIRAAPSWKDKLPSILATLAMQAAFAALLLFSISAVRRELAEQETILFLAPAPRPVTIDARQPPPPRDHPQQPSMTAPPPPLPAYAAPSSGLSASTGGRGALLGALGRHVENCRVERRDADAPCPPSKLAHRDDRSMPLEEERKSVKNAPVWQAEMDRRSAPFTLPGAAGMGPLGVLITALTNPGAFSDPKAYSAPTGPPERMSGAEALQLRRYNNPETSLNGTDFENRVRRGGAAAMKY